MTKSYDIMNSLDDEELKVLMLCFSKPKIIETLRIYHRIPGHGKQAFYDAGKQIICDRRLVHHRNLLEGVD